MGLLDPGGGSNFPGPDPTPHGPSPDVSDYMAYYTWSAQQQQQAGSGGPGGGGVPWQPSFSGGGGQAGPSHIPSIFDPYSGPAIDQALSIVKNFLGWMGYPTASGSGAPVDANQIALMLLQRGLNATPGDAYRWIFYNTDWSDEQRQSHAFAQFGMDPDTFNNRVAGLHTTFQNLLGVDPKYLLASGGSDLNQLYYHALQLGLGQQDILSSLQQMPDLVKQQPWLAVGQGYQQSSQTYTSLYGAPPVDTPTLASWWHFQQGASQLGNRPWALGQAADIAHVGQAR